MCARQRILYGILILKMSLTLFVLWLFDLRVVGIEVRYDGLKVNMKLGAERQNEKFLWGNVNDGLMISWRENKMKSQ